MVKEIPKTVKIDSSEIANEIYPRVAGYIDDETRDYLRRHYEILNEEDVDDILIDETWWNSLLENLINNIKC